MRVLLSMAKAEQLSLFAPKQVTVEAHTRHIGGKPVQVHAHHRTVDESSHTEHERRRAAFANMASEAWEVPFDAWVARMGGPGPLMIGEISGVQMGRMSERAKKRYFEGRANVSAQRGTMWQQYQETAWQAFQDPEKRSRMDPEALGIAYSRQIRADEAARKAAEAMAANARIIRGPEGVKVGDKVRWRVSGGSYEVEKVNRRTVRVKVKDPGGPGPKGPGYMLLEYGLIERPREA